MRRVLITGAGKLGLAVAKRLQTSGYQVALLDCKGNGGAECEFFPADIREANGMATILHGVDFVVHTAALHGIHIGQHSESEFVDVNVKGTLNVLSAAHQVGVKKVVFASSTSVYGIKQSSQPRAAVFVNEDTPINPIDLNDVCKAQAELLCRYYHASHNLNCVIMRFGRFFCSGNRLAFAESKLSGGLNVRDAARAVEAAINARHVGSGLYCIAAQTRFEKADAEELARDAPAVIERRYKGARLIYDHLGAQLPKTIHRVVDTQRAASDLGFRSVSNFEDSLQSLGSEAGANVMIDGARAVLAAEEVP